MGGARKGNAVPKQSKGRTNGTHRPNNTKISNGGSSRGRSSSNTQSKLRERVDAMERTVRNLGERSANRPSYRDVVISGSTNGGGSSNHNHNHVPTHRPVPVNGAFALDQPNPAMLSTVVAAVMAVLSGRERQLF